MITENIERLCKDKEISVSGLEKLLGFGNSTISKWSKSSPTVEKLKAVSNFFGVSIDELLADETTDTQGEQNE